MEGRRNLCAMLPLPLFEKVGEERKKSGLTNGEYISQVLEEYYRMKEDGGANMAKDTGKERTLAFQISAVHGTQAYAAGIRDRADRTGDYGVGAESGQRPDRSGARAGADGGRRTGGGRCCPRRRR